MKWTPRELEVIQLVQEGLSYKAIAQKLGISPGAVGAYVFRIAQLLPGDESPLRKVLALKVEPSETQ